MFTQLSILKANTVWYIVLWQPLLLLCILAKSLSSGAYSIALASAYIITVQCTVPVIKRQRRQGESDKHAKA